MLWRGLRRDGGHTEPGMRPARGERAAYAMNQDIPDSVYVEPYLETSVPQNFPKSNDECGVLIPPLYTAQALWSKR